MANRGGARIFAGMEAKLPNRGTSNMKPWQGQQVAGKMSEAEFWVHIEKNWTILGLSEYN